jgi:hypothetical protein
VGQGKHLASRGVVRRNAKLRAMRELVSRDRAILAVDLDPLWPDSAVDECECRVRSSPQGSDAGRGGRRTGERFHGNQLARVVLAMPAEDAPPRPVPVELAEWMRTLILPGLDRGSGRSGPGT